MKYPKEKTDYDFGNSVSYPFPLRKGKLVNLYLPVDMTKDETKRLGEFILSLAVEKTKSK